MDLTTTEKISENEKKEMEIENKLAYVLAKVYVQIPWKKIGVKSAHKFFVDRIRASSNSPNFKEFLDLFLKKCNVEFVKIDVEIIDFLDDNHALVMSLLRRESVYIANFALETVELVKEERKLKAQGQTTL